MALQIYSSEMHVTEEAEMFVHTAYLDASDCRFYLMYVTVDMYLNKKAVI